MKIERCLGIIPARGGSKGVPRKNILPLAGKPLLAHTIDQALASESLTQVVVSTDDAEIGAVAREYEADVIWRPAALATDTATSESALLHALNQLSETGNPDPDLVVFLQATSPVRGADDIDQAVDTLLSADADSLLSVTASHRFLWRKDSSGWTSLNYDHRSRPRRQDRPPEYAENGSIYVFKPWVLRQLNNRLGGKISIYEMDYWQSFEIDTEEDFALCEWILERSARRSWTSRLPQYVALLILDFDGVFTDNKVLVFQDGVEAVVCDRGDGMGLELLRETEIPVWVLSSEANPVVKARCDKLGIPCHHNIGLDKAATLSRLLAEEDIPAQHVVYVGNDINDLDCMDQVGFSVGVADAHPDVLRKADLVLNRNGGDGAIRELCDVMIRRFRDI
jgi:N-acylneuraminate cytidylyltransferase